MNAKTRERLRPLGVDRLPGPVVAGVHAAMTAYFDRTTPAGRDVMAADWDQLVILDGCRYDTFERYSTLDGDLERAHSVATATPQFLDRTFAGRSYPETVYVTANPIHRVEEWCAVDLDDVFGDVIDVWESDWDDRLGTVPPDRMADAVRRARERHPDRRLIAHFVQPHYPFVGPHGRSLSHGGINGRRRAEGGSGAADERPVWAALRDGDLPAPAVRRAYGGNLLLTLPYVRALVAGFDGTTVVTSDHGNHLGEVATPFPVRLFGHPEGIRTPELTAVPWLTVRNGGEPATAGRAATPTPTPPPASTPTDGGVDGTDGSRGDPASAGPAAAGGPGRDDRPNRPSAAADGRRDGPLVSVLIPTYYRNERLATALESVRGQRYGPIEVTVVDDSGEGHARPVAERYDAGYVAHDRQRGANRARTTGIEASGGEYVQLLDDDDWLHPGKIGRQVAVLESEPAVGVVYCSHASPDGVRRAGAAGRGSVLREALRFGPKACTNSTMLISAAVLREVLPLARREGADDVGLRIELARRTEFDAIREALVYKDTEGEKRSRKPAVGRELLNIVDEYDALYREQPPGVRETALRKAYSTLGENAIEQDGWSLTAVTAFAARLKYTDRRVPDIARPIAALFGAPGFRLASYLYRRTGGA